VGRTAGAPASARSNAGKGSAVLLRGLGLFAASALVPVGGSIAAYYGQRLLFEAGAGLAVLTGASAVLGLVSGCVLMVRETQLAVHTLAEEAKMQARHHRVTHPPR